ncbi:hypothetical protein YC2023_066958 [Brassica napus]
MRISCFLAQSSLTSYLVKLTVDAIDSSGTKVVQSVAEETETPMSCHDVPETLLMNDPSLLAAIYVSFAAGSHDTVMVFFIPMQFKPEKRYCGWKKRNEFFQSYKESLRFRFE